MKLYGLIGFPLGHSFSEKYFREKFLKENITDCEYRNFPVQSINDFRKILTENPHLRGFNVTIPYKKQIIPFLDELLSPAKEIGAVNTVKIETYRNGKALKLKGYNTDVFGFKTSLKEVLHKEIKKALIFGTGGAAVAVEYALASMGISSRMVSRKYSEKHLSYLDLNDEILKEYLLLVNTTPLGTYPEINTAPDIPYQFIGSSHILFDLVYNPSETLFMKKGKKQGAKVKNGHDMLVNQAEKVWEIWNS
ncbi:MAG: shikimate dehydrogenase family protein [Bacteroidota bacterium]